jgi:anti-sigma-K factor RskA
MSGLTCAESRELVPLLALDVLDVDERDVLEDHLAGCTACLEDLAGYSETAAAIALALPQHEPSAGLKTRVLSTAKRARVLLPPPPLGPQPARTASWQDSRFARLRVSLTGMVAGLALLLAAGSTVWALNLRAELDAQSARIASLSERAQNYGKVTAVLQAADTQVRILEGMGNGQGAFGRVYIDPDTSDGMMMVRGLPPLPAGRVYQLWVVGADGQRQSAGVLTWTDKSGNGYTLIQCPDTLARWKSFGVTEEPSGGSPAPTTPRVLGGTI